MNRNITRPFRRRRFRSALGALRAALHTACRFLIPFLLLVAAGIILYDIGFHPFWRNSPNVRYALRVLLASLAVLMPLRYLFAPQKVHKKGPRIVNLSAWGLVLILLLIVLPRLEATPPDALGTLIWCRSLLYGSLLLLLFTEISTLLQFVYNHSLSPALLFVGSFAVLILLGSLLLKLPNATQRGITFLDAVFTATSAVCVTGLTVIDTATEFTTFGQLIILLLIQVGGLGIMTFAGMLAYAVSGGISLRSQLAFRDMMSHREVSNIMQFVYQVVIVTLLFELIGAGAIYLSMEGEAFTRPFDRVFFSLFHAVSAFCNAGFSTYSNGLYEPAVRFNYPLQFSVAVLIILGGIGFPILFNIARYFRVRVANGLRILSGRPAGEHVPRLISLNARLALVVTAVLLLIGFTAYLLFEGGHALKDHPTVFGKIVTSFFGSVTPRTAGFNTVDLTALSLPTIMIYLLLMWIGASPGSTGGGIRTTTIGLAFLNLASVLKGKDRTEAFGAEIKHDSTRRAFAIMLLSFVMIGLFTFLLSINDGHQGLVKLVFEVFSAFSTVGLTLGLTPQLSEPSRVVLIITMFVGRVGMITLLVAFIRQSRQLYYRYPKENIAF